MKPGMTWRSLLSVAFLCLLVFGWVCARESQAGMIVGDPSLPPVGGQYDGDPLSQVANYGAFQATEIRMVNFQNISRATVGADEQLSFDVTLTALATAGGGIWVPISFTGPLTAMVFGKAGMTTGTFIAEITSVACTGSIGPVSGIIRESPNLATMGQFSIVDLGGGLYEIDSFFDLYTELSVLGGPFVPDSNGPHHMVLVPEPATLMLLLLPAAAMIRKRRHL